MDCVDPPQSNRDTRRLPPEHLAVGRIVRPHGVRGVLVVKAFSELIQILAPSTTIYLGSEKTPAIVGMFQPHQDRFLLTLEGCNDRQAAECWRGIVIYIRFEDARPLSEDVYYHWQILDLQVFTEEGEFLGKVAQILETGANDVYVVKDEDGVELLIPAIESVILEVDLDLSRMVVNMLPGLRPVSP